jgi:hypothetical protein
MGQEHATSPSSSSSLAQISDYYYLLPYNCLQITQLVWYIFGYLDDDFILFDGKECFHVSFFIK